VLITGANSGIGLATALELASRGCQAVGTVRSPAKAQLLEAAARSAGVEVRTAILDVNDADACARVIDEYRPHALVNNAGYAATGAVEDVDDPEAKQLIETMLVAPMRLARLAIPHMRRRKRGTIVNISSIAGRVTVPFNGWYQACKHGLEAVSDALRVEVARDGIKVVLVEPGGFRTGIWENSENSLQRRKGSRYSSAYGRLQQTTQRMERIMGDPATVAKVIARAIEAKSPHARYLVGYDARAMVVLDRVPTAVKDRISRITLGL